MLKFRRIPGCVLLAFSALAVEVRVVDSETGRPIVGATVIFPGSTNKADESGQATGSGSRVIAHKSGYVPMKMSWTAGAEPPQFEFKLIPAQTIGGRVVDAATNPVSGAAITVVVPGRLTEPRFAVEDFPIVSDSEGRWRCDFVPKDAAYVRLEFFHPDFNWAEKEISLNELRAERAELKVSPVVTFGGRVLDTSGQAVAGAKVILGSEHSVYDEPETRTDAEGRFAFARQRPHRRLLAVDAEGWAPTVQFVETNFSLIEIRLQKGSPLRVRVEDDSGHPLPGVDATVTEVQGANRGRWSYSHRAWITDLHGTLVWANAPTQSCAWNFSKSGYMGRNHLQLRPTNNEAVVKLGPAFRLTGTVVDAVAGKSIPEFVLNGRYVQPQPYASPGTWYDWNRKTFRDGKFSVEYDDPLLGGSSQMHDWQFRVEAEGYEPALSRVIRDEERGTNITFQLTRRAPPQMNVPTPSGKTRVTAAVALQPAAVGPGETFTVFIKARIAEGHWIYAMEDSGSENIPTSIEASVPRTAEPEAPWRRPQPKVLPDDSRRLGGEVLFSRPYLVEGYAQPQKHKLRFKLHFQVCNELVCWPPEAVDMETELEIVKPRL
jgi:hypothetical protein